MNSKNWNDRADKDLFFTILSVKNIGIISGGEWTTIGNHMRTLGYGFTNEGCRQHFQGLRRAQNKVENGVASESARRADPTMNPITRRPGPGRGRPRKQPQASVNGPPVAGDVVPDIDPNHPGEHVPSAHVVSATHVPGSHLPGPHVPGHDVLSPPPPSSHIPPGPPHTTPEAMADGPVAQPMPHPMPHPIPGGPPMNFPSPPPGPELPQNLSHLHPLQHNQHNQQNQQPQDPQQQQPQPLQEDAKSIQDHSPVDQSVESDSDPAIPPESIGRELDDLDDDSDEPDPKRPRLSSPEPVKEVLDDEAVLALAAHSGVSDPFPSDFSYGEA
ncbi:hypothetical protein QQZ08_002861 [Neonectria magnoliae]|uniref:Myb-like domain-containing protein n=1 Tax=Neonectria magnoliae TaxID=2732573 RepID=A0ABR1IAE4_9HYPO